MIQLHNKDCLAVLSEMSDNSIDAGLSGLNLKQNILKLRRPG